MKKRNQTVGLATMAIAGLLFLIYGSTLSTAGSSAAGIAIALCGIALVVSAIWGFARLRKAR